MDYPELLSSNSYATYLGITKEISPNILDNYIQEAHSFFNRIKKGESELELQQGTIPPLIKSTRLEMSMLKVGEYVMVENRVGSGFMVIPIEIKPDYQIRGGIRYITLGMLKREDKIRILNDVSRWSNIVDNGWGVVNRAYFFKAIGNSHEFINWVGDSPFNSIK